MKKLTGSRLIFLFVAITIITVLSIVSALSLYNQIESLLVEEKGEKATSVSAAVAKLVEQDYASFLRLLNVDEYKVENYDVIYHAKMQQLFREVKTKTDVKFLYCAKRISEDKIVYIFDGEAPRSELYSPLGSEDSLDKSEKDIYLTKAPGYTPIINYPEWGSLLTGMSPLIDPSTGETVAHIGVDVSVDSIQTSLAGINRVLMINALLITIITSLIIYRLLCMPSIFTETDYLTGLHSKGYQDRFLKQQIKKSTITGRRFPLVMIDFDDFKQINDQYGHHFGDIVLKSVSNIIKICTRSVDCCARYGGDEFVIILPEANLEYATLVCQWMLKEVAALKLKSKEDDIVPVSISIGIAIWEANMTQEQILDHADKALYHSKRTGKKKIAVYSNELA